PDRQPGPQQRLSTRAGPHWLPSQSPARQTARYGGALLLRRPARAALRPGRRHLPGGASARSQRRGGKDAPPLPPDGGAPLPWFYAILPAAVEWLPSGPGKTSEGVSSAGSIES